MQKPAVICYIDEEVGTLQHKMPDQIADGVFETDERRCLHIAIGQAKSV